jgi:uncharacterized membrane protein
VCEESLLSFARCLSSVIAAIITKINVTTINDETTVIIVSVAISQTLIVAIIDPAHKRIETFVSSRAIRP